VMVSWIRLGEAHLELKDYSAALDACNKALAALEKLRGRGGDAKSYDTIEVEIRVAIARCQALLGERQALETMRQLPREAWADVLSLYGAARAAADDVPQVVETVNELLKLTPESLSNLFNAACLLTQCLPDQADDQPDPLPPELEALAKQAVELLQRLHVAGFFAQPENSDRLADPDFGPLRRREDFRQLWDKVKATAIPR